MLGADHLNGASPAGHRNVVLTGYGRLVLALETLFGSLVVQLPVLAVLIVGLVLISSAGRLPARSAMFARAGLLIMLSREVLSLIWSVVFPHVVIRSGYGSGALTVRTVGFVSAAVSFVLELVFAAGLALLVAGLVGARRGAGTPVGNPTHTTPIAYPTYGTPTGNPADGAPNGNPTYGVPTGYPAYGAPTGYPAYRAPAGYTPPYGAPASDGSGSFAATPVSSDPVSSDPVAAALVPHHTGGVTAGPVSGSTGSFTGGPVPGTLSRVTGGPGSAGEVAAGETGRIVPHAQDPWSDDPALRDGRGQG
jgi:hypothetical protein